MLTDEQKTKRDGRVTASFLPALMHGDETIILAEWRRLAGDPGWQEPDFTDNWPVKFGEFIEGFALDWHQRQTGQPLVRRGEVVTHPERDWFCCTLDAVRESPVLTVVDCKAPGQWRKLDDVLSYYIPQLVGQRACVGADKAALLVVHGGSKPTEYPVEWQPSFEAEVWDRVEWFWGHVVSLTPPVEVAPVASAPAVKIYDMRPLNSWATLAGDWVANIAGKRIAEKAERELKALVPDDGARAHGHGVTITRDRAGRLTIRENK
jgi:hypothetical protein